MEQARAASFRYARTGEAPLMDPKASENDAAKAAGGIGPDKAKKSRPAVEIDLPAHAVKEEPAEAPHPETASPQPDPESRDSAPRGTSPKLVPALLGLIAGAVGGVGAWHVTGLMDGGVGKLTAGLDQRLTRLEQARPASPPDLAERLTRAERSLAEALPREQTLRAEIGKLQAAITAEQGERTKALAALGERASAPSPAASDGGSSPNLDEIRAQMNALGGQMGALGPRVNEMADRVATLTQSIGQVAGQDDLSRAAAMLVTTGLLGEAFQKHEALGGILETLRAMGAGEAELAPLKLFATSPPPSPSALLAELRAIPSKKSPDKAEGDLFERLRSGAASLVDIRRTGEITGTDDAAHIARAEQALQRGDVGLALTLIGRLTPGRAGDFTGWRSRAEQRVNAVEALGKLRAASLARLSRAASGAK
ncbi:MAG: hypothetical protein J0L51_05715 [Rhizobiales bacterium]|nr:hypothetical protein [Hyphomicrobiales bacterium]